MLFYEAIQKIAEEQSLLIKFNPYHDAKGRFTSAGGAHSVHNQAGQKFTTALGMKHHGHDVSDEDIKSQVAHMAANKGNLSGRWHAPSHKAMVQSGKLKHNVSQTKKLPKSVRNMVETLPESTASKLGLETSGKTKQEIKDQIAVHLLNHKWTGEEIDNLPKDIVPLVAMCGASVMNISQHNGEHEILMHSKPGSA